MLTANIPLNTPWQQAEYERNRPLTDEDLSRILPENGYEVSKCLILLCSLAGARLMYFVHMILVTVSLENFVEITNILNNIDSLTS